MTSTQTFERQTDFRVLETAEVETVSGGYLPTVDVSGMPDRSVVCGTMWYMDRLIKILTGQRP
jgi:hypothetical protein